MGCDSQFDPTVPRELREARDFCAREIVKEPEDYSPLLQRSIEAVQGRKNDEGKLRYDLIPPGPLAELARVYTIGASKYDDRNWENGIKWGRIFAAMMRHAWKFWCGERNDPVDGQHHLASVAWCAFALMEYETTHPELDTRPRGEK